MPEACSYNNDVGTRLRRVRSPPGRSPAQQLTLGRHGPYRDANTAHRLPRLFLVVTFFGRK